MESSSSSCSLSSFSSERSLLSSSSIAVPSAVSRSRSFDATGRVARCFCIDFSTLNFAYPLPQDTLLRANSLPLFSHSHVSSGSPDPRRGRSNHQSVQYPVTSLHRATWLGTDIAVKIFHRDPTGCDPLDALLLEVDLVSRLRHPQISLYMDACADESKPLAVVYEFRPEFWIPGVVDFSGNASRSRTIALQEYMQLGDHYNQNRWSQVARHFCQAMGYIESVLGIRRIESVRIEALVWLEESWVIVILSPLYG